MPQLRPSFLLLLVAPAILLCAAAVIRFAPNVVYYPPAVPVVPREMNTTGSDLHPTLADFWGGEAEFILDLPATGLPMGESDTIIRPDGSWWSYIHSSFQAAETVDQCGDPVPFPGCTVILKSDDQGRTFVSENPPVCQFSCRQCPCTNEADQIAQQQYPRVAPLDRGYLMVYEHLGRAMIRRSLDGELWSRPERVSYSGLWSSLEGCAPEEEIGPHPFNIINLEQCLAGGPPGLFVENDLVYIFVGMGQSPGSMGCFVGRVNQPPATYRRCENNPLFRSAAAYGPLDAVGVEAHPYWDFRMVSSADVIKIDKEYYMLYEGIRGAGAGAGGDSQFGLGLARTVDGRIDGRWETFSGNPILVDLPANVGLGHADLLTADEITYLYTSLDGESRVRLRLVWSSRPQN